jgi:peptidoglycan hydrolase CwlO-like protein
MNFMMYQANLRELGQAYTLEFYKESVEEINNIVNLLEENNLNFLLNIFEDDKYLKTILLEFEYINAEIGKLNKSIEHTLEKIEENKKEILNENKRIQSLKKDVKIVKKQMEKFLTDALKRKVNIMGDINLIA